MRLLIPGPVQTQEAVRRAMSRDYAPWDIEFKELYSSLCSSLLSVAGADPDEHITLPIQGCGHFAIEAAIRAFIPVGNSILVPQVGTYSQRLTQLALQAGRKVVGLRVSETDRLDPEQLKTAILQNPDVKHVALIQSETSTGIVHDIPTLSYTAGQLDCRVIIDAVSAFGAIPINLSERPEIDALIFTSNKCLQGPPGLAIVIASRSRLHQIEAGSWSLDLNAIASVVAKVGPGVSRFTPPTQVVAGLYEAVKLFEACGGQPSRLERYNTNMQTIYDGAKAIGLSPYLSRSVQGPIVVNVLSPPDAAWNLSAFVSALRRRKILISDFYHTEKSSFRVGCIGDLAPPDMVYALSAIDDALSELKIHSRSG